MSIKLNPKERLTKLLKENSGDIQKTEKLLQSFIDQLNQRENTEEFQRDFVLDMLLILKPEKYEDKN